MEILYSEKQMRELGLLNLQKRDLLTGCYAEERVDVFHAAFEFRSKPSGGLFPRGRFWLSIRKDSFGYWN